MSSPIEQVHLRRGQNLDFDSFYSGIKQIIGVLLDGVINPEASPEEEVRFLLNQLFEPFSSLKEFNGDLVDKVCESVSQYIVGLTKEQIQQIRSGINSDGFREVVHNLYKGLEKTFDDVLARLAEADKHRADKHALKAFLNQSDASSCLGKIYGATILVLAGAWFQGEEIKGCCISLVRILVEKFLGIDHEYLGPSTRPHIERAAIILGAPQPEALKQL